MAELTGQSQSSGQSESLAENTQPAIEVDPQVCKSNMFPTLVISNTP